MRHAREKRRLLGALAAMAPLPLPFNDVVGWVSLVLYEAAIVWFVVRSERGAESWLSFRMMNVLAVAYLPFLALDLGVLWRGRVLQPLVHLAMFTLVVKLFGLRREKDAWHALFGVFFLFLAGTGTSVHPSLALYLVAWWTLGLYVLMRFAALELFARHREEGPLPAVPVRAFLIAGVPFLLLVAVPLFAFMPRLRQPYVMIPGGGSGGATGRVSGLQENEISLDFIGRIRTDRSVAFRVRYEGPRPAGHELRFRAGSFEVFEENRWSRDRTGADWDVQRGPDGFFRVAPGRLRGWMEIWLQPGGSKAVPVPVDTAAVDIPFGFFVLGLEVDEAGVVRLPRPPRELMTYRAARTDGAPEPERGTPRRLQSEVPVRRGGAAALDAGGVTPRIAALAERVAGAGSPEERARRLTDHLLSEYEYTLDLLGGRGGHRVETFLFDDRRGHCELFASALTLMLRSQGIPARLTTGYLGGDYNPLESYYVVRQANAHAWVEAELEPGRWLVLDPTPPVGRPGEGGSDLGAMVTSVYDFVLFRWDRYVLTYGFADQVGAMLGLRDLWLDLSAWWKGRNGGPRIGDRPAEDPGAPPEVAEEAAGEDPAGGPGWLGSLPLFLLVAGVALWAWLQRPGLSARRAYLELRRRLPPDERPPATIGPLAVSRHWEAHGDELRAAAARRIVALYIEEAFGGRSLEADERDELAAAWKSFRSKKAA